MRSIKPSIPVVSFFALLYLSTVVQAESADLSVAAAKADSVLLVYTSGEPFATVTDIKDTLLLDAISSGTSKERSTARIAGDICERLTAAGSKVRLARVEEFSKKDSLAFMAYGTIIVGSPTRIGNYAWEMKRFLDLVFISKYFRPHPEQVARTRFGLFSNAYGETGAKSCLAILEKDFGHGTVVSAQPFTSSMSDEDYQAALEKFCADISGPASGGGN